MAVQAIDQNIFPKVLGKLQSVLLPEVNTIFPSVLGKTKVFYCPRSWTSGNRPLWVFPSSSGKLF